MVKKAAVKKAAEPLPVEQGALKSKPFMMDGKPTTMRVSEKMGSDGVLETHVNYERVPKPPAKNWGRVKDKLCGSCMKWILKDYKEKPHGFPCVPKKTRKRKS